MRILLSLALLCAVFAASLATQAEAREQPVRGWNWLCLPAGNANVDPITGMTHHNHFFAGALPGAEDDTVGEIRALDNNCHWPHNDKLEAGDQNLYWVINPVYRDSGEPVRMGQNNAYYRVARGHNPDRVTPPPNGLKYIIGNPIAPISEQRGIKFRCPGVKGSGVKDYRELDCRGKSKNIKMTLVLPACSNGEPDSADNRSHLVYGGKRGCPKSHPRQIPELGMNFSIRMDEPVGKNLKFVNEDMGIEIAPHGDFFNATRFGVWKDVITTCMKSDQGGCSGTGISGKFNP